MATIILEQGETFEHFHLGETTTYLISGEVELEVDGVTERLDQNRIVHIPPAKSHTIKNIGLGTASVGCGHT